MTMATGAFKMSGLSSNNIGNQHVLDLLYLVFQIEFHFFQPPQLQLVARSGLFQRGNRRVEITVLLQQILQLCPKGYLLQRVHRPQPAPKALISDPFTYALESRSTSPQVYVIMASLT
jgi:hypothetical protein